MNIIKQIMCASLLMITSNALSMRYMSEITTQEAQDTILGLQHLDGKNQKIYFDHLSKMYFNPYGNTEAEIIEFAKLRHIAQNNKHPHTKKVVTPTETKSHHPKIKTANTLGNKAARVLNVTLHLSEKDHQKFKNYFDIQRMNSAEYNKLLTGNSDNLKIQKLLNRAKNNRNPHINKIIQQNTKTMCPQLSWEKAAKLKQQYANYKQPLMKIKIKSDIKRSPKKSPEKLRGRLFLSA